MLQKRFFLPFGPQYAGGVFQLQGPPMFARRIRYVFAPHDPSGGADDPSSVSDSRASEKRSAVRADVVVVTESLKVTTVLPIPPPAGLSPLRANAGLL